MKTKTKIEDLKKLIALEKAKDAEHRTKYELSGVVEVARLSGSGIAADALQRAQDAHAVTSAAEQVFASLPRLRREQANAIRAAASTVAISAARVGKQYSGVTNYSVIWSDATDAKTVVESGTQYSRSCKFRMSDAHHKVYICPDDILHLVENQDAGWASKRDGIHLIGLREDGSAKWVKLSNKAIHMVSGWYVYRDGIGYHSTVSLEHCQKGLARKIKLSEQERIAAMRDAKSARRARLVARLCDGVLASVADAREMGFCEAGIQQFQSQFGIGDVASLPELVRTGDPSATALAFKIARRI